MTLNGQSSEFEIHLPKAERAGLRVRPTGPGPHGHGPTGVFVVVEMAVLVIVTALAMVSIIVSVAEEDRTLHVGTSTSRADVRVAKPATNHPVDLRRTVDATGQ